MDLMPLEEALSYLLKEIKPLPPERVFIKDALGRVLAEDVASDTDKPLFDNSAMDGFAVIYKDIEGASEEHPAVLRIIGEASAGGETPPEVTRGKAVKIFTGAPIPEGADTVVPVEFTEVKDDTLLVKKSLKQGANIRRRGEDLKEGETVLKKGHLIRGYEVGMLAFLNRTTVLVHRKPKVAVLSTGDELLEVGESQTRPSQIRSSNHHMIYSLVQSAGADPVQLGIAPDDPQELLELLRTCKDYDIFITTGGVSMGEKDYIQFLVREVGVDVKFHRLRIKPAKPVLFGTYGEHKLFFGLPGNPVSCAIAFDLFILPSIRGMLGLKNIFRTKLRARLVKPFKRKDSYRREFARATVRYEGGEFLCEPHPKLQSHMLSSVVESNAYMIVMEGVNELPEGAEVDVILIGDIP